MKVTIFGSGYVGLVTGACLAEAGHHVMCVDVDEQKIALLNAGGVPIYEPGLDTLIAEGRENGRLQFTASQEEGVAFGTFQFIAVGTPPDEDGSADLQYVLQVARAIGQHMNDEKIIVDKSTVPVGTGDKVKACVAEQLQQRSKTLPFHVVSNPEFLKEGAAIADARRPDRIVVGAESEEAHQRMRQLYAPFNRNHDRIVAMDIRSAELTKYAANAMLATKISFMNEIANLAEYLGADVEMVRQGIGSDPRIGFHFIYPGTGYGGSCFPKDVQALKRMAEQIGYEPLMMRAVEAVNQRQKMRLVDKVHACFGQDLSGKTFALWGLAFKPNTDDMREAPSRVIMEALWKAGARVQAYDPEAMQECRRIYGDRDDLQLCDNADQALEGADALLLVTEWKRFWNPDLDNLKRRLKQPVLFDGRNIYDPMQMQAAGFRYFGIGRGERLV